MYLSLHLYISISPSLFLSLSLLISLTLSLSLSDTPSLAEGVPSLVEMSAPPAGQRRMASDLHRLEPPPLHILHHPRVLRAPEVERASASPFAPVTILLKRPSILSREPSSCRMVAGKSKNLATTLSFLTTCGVAHNPPS